MFLIYNADTLPRVSKLLQVDNILHTKDVTLVSGAHLWDCLSVGKSELLPLRQSLLPHFLPERRLIGQLPDRPVGRGGRGFHHFLSAEGGFKKKKSC